MRENSKQITNANELFGFYDHQNKIFYSIDFQGTQLSSIQLT